VGHYVLDICQDQMALMALMFDCASLEACRVNPPWLDWACALKR
jgi:hypothetical protein